MAADFKNLIALPGWLQRPAAVAQAKHQNTLFARAIGALFNSITPLVYEIRREWIVNLSSGVFLDEHGKDRAIFRRAWESDEDFKARVLTGLRAKIPGETLPGMQIALNTLGLKNYTITPLWKTDLEHKNLLGDAISAARFAEFEVRFLDTDNLTLTDAAIKVRADAAKAPSKRADIVRLVGDGFGQLFGTNFGGGQGGSTVHPQAGFGTDFGTNFGG